MDEVFIQVRISQCYSQAVTVTSPVRGQVNGLTRKRSRKLGIMDVLEYTLHLDRNDGTRACTITNTWILPRGHDNAA
ncbi:hypothetical protein CHELA20_40381 [Hyphomicrobiales bacterium]|nr:hypothetical protein CHELA20_40381 [Hyphomicrobiales bacterium]CAH1688426.1 hypothetical protein CHELA41_40238 [Hyphomicrobiales bacterium]